VAALVELEVAHNVKTMAVELELELDAALHG
jgi:hypothetical protein